MLVAGCNPGDLLGKRVCMCGVRLMLSHPCRTISIGARMLGERLARHPITQ